MVNKVILVGRLCSDPDVRALSDGRHVTKLRVATNTFGGRDEDGNRKEHTEFHTVVLFGRQAEAVGSHLRKGELCYTEGRLQHRSWETDGQKRYTSEVVAESVEMLGRRPQEAVA